MSPSLPREIDARDEELVARWRGEPAPLLATLHAFHDRDGHLSENALRAVSKGLRIPLADLYGTVTFYHHFSREAGGRRRPRVCVGPACRMRGADSVLAALAPEGALPMPCAGRCDDGVPVIRSADAGGDEVLIALDTAIGQEGGARSSDLVALPSPLPPPPAEGIEECCFAHIREPDRATFAGYRRTGGYDAIESVVRTLEPSELIEMLVKSRLAGRGGAGFPTGTKWKLVAEAPGGPKTIVCNADEGEPGCFKDRALLDHDPHAVIEGMLLAAYATGATRGFIYLRYEYPETEKRLARALRAATENGLLGERALGGPFRIDVRRGAGAYICGEEGSLLNSLEGKHPFPRNRPPYPVTSGFEGTPTAVNNVETLVSVPPIVRKGAEWYRSLGRGEHAGTKLVSLSGDVQRPGNYEVPMGLPLSTLIHDWAGGPRPGRKVRAVTMAGLSGGFLAGADLEVTLDEPSIRAKGSFLGAAGIIVFDDSRDLVAAAHDAMEFFAEESCGKCFPCRIGTRRITERLAGHAGPSELSAWRDEVRDLGEVMRATSACGLGMAAPLVSDSLLRYFPDEVAAHVKRAGASET